MVLALYKEGGYGQYNQDGCSQTDGDAPQAADALRSRLILGLAAFRLAAQIGCFRVVRKGSYSTDSEVKIVSTVRPLRQGKAGVPTSLFGWNVVRPKGKRLGVPEDGLVEFVITAVRLAEGGRDVFIGAHGQDHAFLMSDVFTQRLLELLNSCVTVLRLRRHGFPGDVHEFPAAFTGFYNIVGGGGDTSVEVVARVGQDAGRQFVKDGAEKVDVGSWTDAVGVGAGHFRSHVGGSAGPARRYPRAVRKGTIGKGDPPVHDQYFAEVAKHDVLGFEIPVHHAAVVGEGDGIGHAKEDVEVLGFAFLPHHGSPGAALYFLHGIEYAGVGGDAKLVNRNYVGMVQRPGENSFGDELVLDPVGLNVFRSDKLHRDVPVQAGLPCLEHRSHAANAESLGQYVIADLRRLGRRGHGAGAKSDAGFSRLLGFRVGDVDGDAASIREG